MKILWATFENFMGYVGRHRLDLEELGLVAVTGRNLDDPGSTDNGSCKTTILEGLTWCLWGEGLPRREGNAEKGVQADEVLSDRHPKQCRVEMGLVDDETGDTYVVARWRRWKADKGAATSGASLTVNGVVREAQDTAETNKWIRDCLGMDRDIWTRSVIFGQESQFNFCEATEGDRSKILTTVMGLEAVDRWLGRCRDEQKAGREKIAGVTGGLQVLHHQLAETEKLDPAAKVDAWEAQRADRVAKFTADRAQKEAEGKALAAELEALGPFTEPEPARYEQQPVELPEAPGPVVAPVPVRPADPKVRQAALDADLAWREQIGEAARAQARVGAAQQALQEAKAIQAGATCPACRQPVTEAHKATCVEAAAQAVFEADQAARPVLDELARRKQVAAEAEAAQQAELARFRQDQEAAQQAMDAAAAQAQQVYRAALAEAQAAQQAEARKASESWEAVQAWQQRKQQHEARGAQLKAQLDVARMDWKQCAVREREVAEEPNPHLQAVTDHEDRIQDLRDQLLHLEADHEDLLEKMAALDWWEKELPRFKTWMFDGVVDTLAAEANRWLRVMSGGVIWVQISTTKMVGKGSKRRAKDALEVTVYRWNPDGTTTSRIYRLWSGGEKRRVALAVDLGLSRLMAQRASKAYRFLALDEVDRHLDDRGREGLRQVLDELRAERETCMVITHDPEFRASFDNKIEVTKQGGASSWEVQRVA